MTRVGAQRHSKKRALSYYHNFTLTVVSSQFRDTFLIDFSCYGLAAV